MGIELECTENGKKLESDWKKWNSNVKGLPNMREECSKCKGSVKKWKRNWKKSMKIVAK